MKVLLLGCGVRREKLIPTTTSSFADDDLVTLDLDRRCKPDVEFDLSRAAPLPFADDVFHEIHAYEVLEHIGQQGDHLALFGQFSEMWRILKPGGLLCGTVPWWDAQWAWGDPSHRRVINRGTLTFLDQSEYDRQSGITPMSDYRDVYHADFELEADNIGGARNGSYCFRLRAIKPSRWRSR